MSQVLRFEDWPVDERPLTAASFCGTLPDSEIPEEVDPDHVVRSNAVRFLESHSQILWPGAAEADGGFRWDLLCANDVESGSGPDRFGSQYWRANIDPSDRYVQALPGTAPYRMRADDSGLDNLFLAGDWIDNGLNAGCIESAVLGGLQAANAIEGRSGDDHTSGGYRPHGAPLHA
jgi:uncharacterized protein with NAD-binding domain and iron-sulfur cluster